MRRSQLFLTTALAAISGLFFIVEPAAAQSVGAGRAAPSTSPQTVDEVIVTATKRAQNIQDVPIPISAVTGDQLLKSNAQSLEDYITRMPGVVFNDYQPGVSEVVIRGIESTTYHEQGQTTTGYYLNEVVLVEPGFPIGIPDVDTFDLDRVEVLRGPQGTLFGSSTLGGLVNYVAKTADPKAFGAAAESLVGGTKNSEQPNYDFKGMVNIPIVTDKLAIRLTGADRFDAGYLDNPGVGVKGSNNFAERSLRGSAVYTPVTGTKVTLMSVYEDTQLDDQTYLSDGYTRITPRAEPQKTAFWLNSLRLDQDVGFANLTAIASTDEKQNTTIFSYPYAYVTGVTTGSAAAFDRTRAHANIQTLEARLASKPDGRLHWLIGASFMRATKSSVDHIYQAGAAAYIDANPGDFGGYPGSVLAPNDAIYGYISDTYNRDFGIFGEASYKFTPQWELTFGGRYYDTKNTATITNAAGTLGAGSYTPTNSTFGTAQAENGFTPKVTLAYRPLPHEMIYATYSEGYRVGGPNPNAAILAGIPKNYHSDTVDNYELGIKSSLWGNRVQIDADVFHEDWSNIQARLFTAAPYFYSYVTNAGGARINGVEDTMGFQLTRDLHFSTNVTYQDGQLSKFLPDTFAAGGGYASGTTLPGSSKWAVANNLTYTFTDVRFAPSVELAHRYLSTAPVAFGNPSTRGGFNVVDLRVSATLRPNLRVMAFADNLFNEYGILSGPFTSQTTPAISIIRPQTFGIKLDWSL